MTPATTDHMAAVEIRTETTVVPSWAPSEGGQGLRLGSFDSALRGDVVYPAAFDNLDD